MLCDRGNHPSILSLSVHAMNSLEGPISPIIVQRMVRHSVVAVSLQFNNNHVLSEEQRMVLLMSSPAMQINQDQRAASLK